MGSRSGPVYGMRERLACYACSRKLVKLMAEEPAAVHERLRALPMEDLALLAGLGAAAARAADDIAQDVAEGLEVPSS